MHTLPPPRVAYLVSIRVKSTPVLPRSFKNEPLPVDGYVTLSDAPGFGLELNREANKLTRPYPHTPLSFADIEKAKDARTPATAEWLGRAATIPREKA